MKVLLFSLGSCFTLTQSDSPITKVVNLLNELEARIDADEAVESNVYKKYACWCETTSKRKADAIAQGREDIKLFGTKVLELKAEVARLGKVIKDKKKDLADEERSLAQATALRKKNNEAFLALKAEMEHAIEGLDKAIKVLAGAGTTAKQVLLQSPEFVSLYSTITQVISMDSIKKRDLQLAQELVGKFGTPPPMAADDGSGTYSPQSATIIGILKNMHENFVADLKEATEQEANQLAAFQAKAEASRTLIKELQETIETKTAEKAETESQQADTNQRLLDADNQMHEDVKFFDNTKEACTEKADAWSKRQSSRQYERQGVQKALTILKDKRALFDKSIKAGQETVSSFLQIHHSHSLRAPRNKAFSIISRVAARNQSLRLAALAATVKTNRFGEVIKKIDELLKEMTLENEKDIKERDECQAETHKLNEENKEGHYDVRVNLGVIQKKERIIAQNDADIETANSNIAEAEANLTQLTTERQEENLAFKQAKTDDENAMTVLKEVIEELSKFSKHDGIKPEEITPKESFAQKEPVFEISEDQAPDATFSDKHHRQGESKGIISILEMVKEDLRNEITQGIKDEAASQKAFMDQEKVINDMISALKSKITVLEEITVKHETEINVREATNTTLHEEIDARDTQLEGIKPHCEWLVKNFKKRADNRTAERNALVNAKSVLSGAEMSLISKRNSSFLQKQ